MLHTQEGANVNSGKAPSVQDRLSSNHFAANNSAFLGVMVIDPHSGCHSKELIFVAYEVMPEVNVPTSQ